ncbi:hypothetical protein ACH4KT_38055 [Streptomyces anulatus]
MKKPNRILNFLYGLVGLSYVHESVDEVREAIADNSVSAFTDRRTRIHTQGAAKLTDSLAFQPGLIGLHDEMNDVWQYLVALQVRADALGNATLTDDLEAAANSIGEVLRHVSNAAEATIPHPRVPAAQ